VYFNGSKKICLIFLNLCLARLSNLIWFEYWVFEFKVDWGFISYEVGWVFLYVFFQSGKLFSDGMEVGIIYIYSTNIIQIQDKLIINYAIQTQCQTNIILKFKIFLNSQD
jgi:hypothetical protein